MCVFNGDAYLEEQLQTIADQTWPAIGLWVSDDGSTDNSRRILEQNAGRWTKGSLVILEGPALGFAENFRSLLVREDIDADYVAFCDQDDLWDEDKLSDAIRWLAAQDPATPCLYCTRTRTVDSGGTPIGMSPLFARPPSFRNAIVQSIAGANTMVMNRAAHRLVAEASRRASFVSHDWWCYLLVSGAGGKVRYSPVPKIGYRQHAGNLVGANNSMRAQVARVLSLLFEQRFSGWNALHLRALNSCTDLLSEDSRRVLKAFEKVCNGAFFSRLGALFRSGIYRQTAASQLALIVACALKRL